MSQVRCSDAITYRLFCIYGHVMATLQIDNDGATSDEHCLDHAEVRHNIKSTVGGVDRRNDCCTVLNPYLRLDLA